MWTGGGQSFARSGVILSLAPVLGPSPTRGASWKTLMALAVSTGLMGPAALMGAVVVGDGRDRRTRGTYSRDLEEADPAGARR